ncbi:MAG: bifunctional riboflavin kinase/FAD synthetase [Granulosicoccaceae bacterium]
MQLIRGLKRSRHKPGCVATIGNFDGLHLGHQQLVNRMLAAASLHALPATLISFDPLPHEFFAQSNAPARINGFRDRYQSAAAMNIEHYLLLDFDQAMADLSPQAFIEDVFIHTLGVKHLVVGDDFRFGHRREGDITHLQLAGEDHGFTVEQIPTVTRDNTRISSSEIRAHLASGRLDEATAMLGRPYTISGRVIHGEKVGRQLGFATANVALGKHRPPARGVFAVQALHRETGEQYRAVANLGERPTLGGRKLLLEVHCLDDNPDLYGQHLQVEFMHYLRAERKFDSLDDLKQAIAADADAARHCLR